MTNTTNAHARPETDRLATWNSNRNTFSIDPVTTYEDGADRIDYALTLVTKQIEAAREHAAAYQGDRYSGLTRNLDRAAGIIGAIPVRLAPLADEYERTSAFMDEVEAMQGLRRSINRMQEAAGNTATELEFASLEADWLDIDAMPYLAAEENVKRLERLIAAFGFLVNENIRNA